MIDGRDVDWAEAMATAQPADCVPVAATDPLYILYTSGTTGQPKGVVRDNGGHMVALKWSMKAIYDIDAGDVYWAASDVGWVVGHSYIVYAPLFKGATTILFEGKPVGTPDAGVFWRVISQHKVKCMFTAPTAFRAIKREDPKAELMKDYDLSNFKILFLAGERSDPDTLQWAENNLGSRSSITGGRRKPVGPLRPTAWACTTFPVKYGSPTKAAPAGTCRWWDACNQQVAPGEIGALVVKLPLPPGTLPTLVGERRPLCRVLPGRVSGLLQDRRRRLYRRRGLRLRHGPHRRHHQRGRPPPVHRRPWRRSSPTIRMWPSAPCWVSRTSSRARSPSGFLVLKAGVDRDPAEIQQEVVQMVRDRIGPVAAFKTATVVNRLPKTRSGKILRGTIQKIADNKDYNVPATIDDPTILGEMEVALNQRRCEQAVAPAFFMRACTCRIELTHRKPFLSIMIHQLQLGSNTIGVIFFLMSFRLHPDRRLLGEKTAFPNHEICVRRKTIA
jgi:propionyl-CoA synthetase